VSAEGERLSTVSREDTAPRSNWGRWTRGVVFAFVALVVAALVGLLAFGLLNKGEEGSGSSMLNREAPDFALSLFNGGTFTLSENRNQPVVMNIWASWCEPCWEEASVLEGSWRSFRDQGVIFVGVNVMDSRGDAEAFLKQFDVTYPNGPDESDIYLRYRATGTPETFFIDRDGVIVERFMGPLDADHLSTSVEDLLK
jgi:cytochrome c biogenesis protein CcmG/thiol:disulfide interchange protein DsbE